METFATINPGQPWRWISIAVFVSAVYIKGDRGKPRVLEKRGRVTLWHESGSEKAEGRRTLRGWWERGKGRRWLARD